MLLRPETPSFSTKLCDLQTFIFGANPQEGTGGREVGENGRREEGRRGGGREENGEGGKEGEGATREVRE